jgi:integrase
LTCTRPGEAIGTKWDEIKDLDSAEPVRIVPAGAMKTRRPHKVPLSTQAVEILKLARQFNDGAIVFPGRYAGHPLSDMTMNTAMQRLGVHAETAVPHGFRTTFKTWAQEETHFDHLVIEACMAHAVKGIERHYLRTTFFEQRQKLMQLWADFVTSVPRAKVVSISRGQ